MGREVRGREGGKDEGGGGRGGEKDGERERGRVKRVIIMVHLWNMANNAQAE